MMLSDLDPPTLRVIAAALECKARFGLLGPGTIAKLAKHEPGANVNQALAVLGFGPRMVVGFDASPRETAPIA
jgi:hypothetical protein